MTIDRAIEILNPETPVNLEAVFHDCVGGAEK